MPSRGNLLELIWAQHRRHCSWAYNTQQYKTTTSGIPVRHHKRNYEFLPQSTWMRSSNSNSFRAVHPARCETLISGAHSIKTTGRGLLVTNCKRTCMVTYDYKLHRSFTKSLHMLNWCRLSTTLSDTMTALFYKPTTHRSIVWRSCQVNILYSPNA